MFWNLGYILFSSIASLLRRCGRSSESLENLLRILELGPVHMLSERRYCKDAKRQRLKDDVADTCFHDTSYVLRVSLFFLAVPNKDVNS
jgi:hypothetical protein